VTMFGYRSCVRLACTLTVLVCGACSLFLDVAPDQCHLDADCAALGAGLKCSVGSCVRPTAALEAGSVQEAAAPCQSNAQCIDDHLGEPYICEKVSRACVPIKQDGACAFVLPEAELRNDNAVLVAAFIPLLNQAAPLNQPLPLAYKLALDEIQKAGGLPGGVGSPRKPIVAAICDSDPSTAENGVRYVTQTLHVPAIVSLFSQTDQTRFFQDYLLPAGTFTLNPQDTTEALKAVNANRLLWHLLGTPEDIALAYKPLVARVEAYVKSQYSLSSVRIALITTDSPTETSIAAILRDPTKGIQFNGTNADANGAAFLSLKLPSREATPSATYGTFVDQIATFRPDIVILLTSSLEAADIVGGYIPSGDRYIVGLDTKITAGDGGATRPPFYILGPRNARDTRILDYIGKDGLVQSTEAKSKRFLGVQYAGAADKADPKSQYQQFLKRFAEANPTVAPTSYESVENYYDAVYWLAYGLFAAGPGAPIEGKSFADGVRKLLSGPDIVPGTVAQIAASFQSISNFGDGTTFQGSLGKPDFDTASGAQRSVGAAYCYQKDGVTGAIRPKYDVLRYNRTSGQLDGTFDCFLGF